MINQDTKFNLGDRTDEKISGEIEKEQQDAVEQTVDKLSRYMFMGFGAVTVTILIGLYVINNKTTSNANTANAMQTQINELGEKFAELLHNPKEARKTAVAAAESSATTQAEEEVWKSSWYWSGLGLWKYPLFIVNLCSMQFFEVFMQIWGHRPTEFVTKKVNGQEQKVSVKSEDRAWVCFLVSLVGMIGVTVGFFKFGHGFCLEKIIKGIYDYEMDTNNSDQLVVINNCSKILTFVSALMLNYLNSSIIGICYEELGDKKLTDLY